MDFLTRLSGGFWPFLATPDSDAAAPNSTSSRPTPQSSSAKSASKRSHSRASTASGEPRRKSKKTDHDHVFLPEADGSEIESESGGEPAQAASSQDHDEDMIDGDESESEEVDGDEEEEEIDDEENVEGDLEEEIEAEDPELDQSIVETDEAWAMAERRKKFLIPDRPENHNAFKETLRTAGWNEDHIDLVTHIRLRGHEPLLPDYFKNSYPYLPESLFATGDNYLIGPHKYDDNNSSPAMAISRLFELGPKVRTAIDRESREGRDNQYSPESYSRRLLRDYMKWAVRDASDILYPKEVIPTIVIVDVPHRTPQADMLAVCLRRLRRVANLWRDALTVNTSIEAESSSSPSGNKLVQPIPTLYCFIASRAHVVLMAYRSERDRGLVLNEDGDTEMDIEKGADGTRVIASFNMEEKNHDVWNCFAFALVICQSRDIQLRIAGDTGVAMRTGQEPESDDPDL